MSSFTITLAIAGASVVVAFLSGAITRNYSTVDRLWSILPAVYVLVWMRDFGDNLAFVLPALLVVLWSIRLTANFAAKGGYRFSFRRGFYEEDYRWPILKTKIRSRVLFELFNLGFISLFQLALVFGFTLPLYFLGQTKTELTGALIALIACHAALLITETVADIQQLAYYGKRGAPAYHGDARIALGFNTFGLWRFCRHPNYVCEMGQWIVVYLYLHIAGGVFHFSGLFAGLLVLLFVGSTIMAERITTSKYPAYAEWKKATPPWIPFLDLPMRRKARTEFFEKYPFTQR